ncbi:MAG TPA: hypothetical protein V6D14_12980 [Coleofasciculaceae cyanobacterium]
MIGRSLLRGEWQGAIPVLKIGRNGNVADDESLSVELTRSPLNSDRHSNQVFEPISCMFSSEDWVVHHHPSYFFPCLWTRAIAPEKQPP